MPFLILLLAIALNAQSPLREDTTVPMRDGIRLAATVYRPAAGGKHPTLVVRTPYNRAGAARQAAALAEQGFAVVAQDVRGRFDSPGAFYAFLNEGQDGYDTIEWAAEQPWSNGKVGTFGASYLAWDQIYAAMDKPPHLESMFVVVGGSNFYQDYAYPGGAPNLGWSFWLARSAQTSPLAREKKDEAEQIRKALDEVTAWSATHPRDRTKLFTGFPPHLKMFTDYYAHPNFDDYWRHKGFYYESRYQQIKDVPSLYLSGWYDYFGEGTLKNFSAVQRQKTEKKLIMGPWPHGTGRSECGDAAFGAAAAFNETEFIAEWFNHTLRGAPLKQIRNETVSLFRMGGGAGQRAEGKFQHGGEWLTYSAWPPAAQTRNYYLDRDDNLSPSTPAEPSQSTYIFDPENPVPTVGGRYGTPATKPCAQDQQPIDGRPDVLTFQTPSLETALDVTGMVRARLTVSTNAKDTDFTAKLVDVYPNGYQLIIADSQIRLRFRKGFEKPLPYKPGSKAEVVIDLGSVSNLFAKGHKLRLDVSSSNYPKFEPNPNTGEDAGAYTRRLKAINTIHLGPSRLELPIVN